MASPGALDVVPRGPLGLILSAVLTIRFVAYFCYYSLIVLIKETIMSPRVFSKKTRTRVVSN